MSLRVGVIGCGLIGRRRAAVARELGDHVAVVADVDAARAQATAQEIGCDWTADWQEAVGRTDIEAMVVSTVNKALAPVTIAALDHGKHVLSEKPLGRNSDEAREMVEAAERSGRLLKTGFNHRHHPAIWKAHELSQQGAIGPLMLIRAVYGHGGRPGYAGEWRADAELAGGGELLDQGVHILDLCRWFMGDFTQAFCLTGTYFWRLAEFPAATSGAGRRLEDNAFALLRTPDGRVAQFHTSWTQWINRFSLEVLGRDGLFRVDGLGGSYGTERLTFARRRPEGGVPEKQVEEFTGPDISWQLDWKEFTGAIEHKGPLLTDGHDGLAAMRMIQALYASAWTGQVVEVKS